MDTGDGMTIRKHLTRALLYAWWLTCLAAALFVILYAWNAAIPWSTTLAPANASPLYRALCIMFLLALGLLYGLLVALAFGFLGALPLLIGLYRGPPFPAMGANTDMGCEDCTNAVESLLKETHAFYDTIYDMVKQLHGQVDELERRTPTDTVADGDGFTTIDAPDTDAAGEVEALHKRLQSALAAQVSAERKVASMTIWFPKSIPPPASGWYATCDVGDLESVPRYYDASVPDWTYCEVDDGVYTDDGFAFWQPQPTPVQTTATAGELLTDDKATNQERRKAVEVYRGHRIEVRLQERGTGNKQAHYGIFRISDDYALASGWFDYYESSIEELVQYMRRRVDDAIEDGSTHETLDELEPITPETTPETTHSGSERKPAPAQAGVTLATPVIDAGESVFVGVTPPSDGRGIIRWTQTTWLTSDPQTILYTDVCPDWGPCLSTPITDPGEYGSNIFIEFIGGTTQTSPIAFTVNPSTGASTTGNWAKVKEEPAQPVEPQVLPQPPITKAEWESERNQATAEWELEQIAQHGYLVYESKVLTKEQIAEAIAEYMERKGGQSQQPPTKRRPARVRRRNMRLRE